MASISQTAPFSIVERVAARQIGGVWVTGAERRALSLETRGDNTGSLVSVRNMNIFSSIICLYVSDFMSVCKYEYQVHTAAEEDWSFQVVLTTSCSLCKHKN